MKQDRRPAVLISGGQLAAGGVQTHLEYLIEFLLAQGVDVTVAASGSQWGPAAIEALAAHGCRFIMPPRRLWPWRKLATLWSAVAWATCLWRQSFAAAYFIGGGRSHFLIKRLLGERTTSLYHEIVEAPVAGSDEDRLAASVTAVIANSRKVAQSMRADHPSARVEVIPFLTANRPTPAPADPTNSPGASGTLRLVYLGRLVSHKRPDQLVYRWRELIELPFVAPASLDIYGYDLTHEMFDSLADHIESQGLAQQVRLHGAYDFAQVGKCLADKHLLVLPSLMEGLPLVLVEAMQRGIPFVACSAGGTAEFAEENPDVIVTTTAWDDFAIGLREIAEKVRKSEIDPQRLYHWSETRYGYTAVSQQWLAALLHPGRFFGISDQ